MKAVSTRRRKVSISAHLWGTDMNLGLNRGRTGVGKRYVQVSSPGQSVNWLVVTSVLVLQGGPKKSLLPEENNLALMRWRIICPSQLTIAWR
jgi:hypothetical protein